MIPSPLLRGAAVAAVAALAITWPGLVSTRAQAESRDGVSRTSPSGSSLAARHAGDQRDVAAAASYYRAALRADPGNNELLGRTFLAVLANGEVGAMRSFWSTCKTRSASFNHLHHIGGLALDRKHPWPCERGSAVLTRISEGPAVSGHLLLTKPAYDGAWQHPFNEHVFLQNHPLAAFGSKALASHAEGGLVAYGIDQVDQWRSAVSSIKKLAT